MQVEWGLLVLPKVIPNCPNLELTLLHPGIPIPMTRMGIKVIKEALAAEMILKVQIPM